MKLFGILLVFNAFILSNLHSNDEITYSLEIKNLIKCNPFIDVDEGLLGIKYYETKQKVIQKIGDPQGYYKENEKTKFLLYRDLTIILSNDIFVGFSLGFYQNNINSYSRDILENVVILNSINLGTTRSQIIGCIQV